MGNNEQVIIRNNDVIICNNDVIMKIPLVIMM